MFNVWTATLFIILSSAFQISLAQTTPTKETSAKEASVNETAVKETATKDSHPIATNVYNQVNKSIFTIFGIQDKKGVALGSAVAIGNHVLATNCHIALAGDYLLVKVDKVPKVGQLFYYNKRDDLCLVVVPNAKFSPVKIRPSKNVDIGEEVFAIGNPVRFEKTISKGIISNKFERNGLTMLQTDAPISVGSSGGGLFDINGNLIGITTKKARLGDSIGFAIPTELILAVMNPSQRESSIAEESRKEPSSKMIVRSEPTKESIIKYYGDKKIALGKWKRSCIITMIGIDEQKQSKSFIIWLPGVPNGFFVFPTIYDFNSAINTLNDYVQAGYPSLKNTENFLILNSERFRLRGDVKIEKNFPILILGRRKSFTDELSHSNKLIVELSDSAPQGTKKTISFDLNGFKQALAEYQTICDEKK